MRGELLANATLAEDGREYRTLIHCSDMTGADRTWAARYNPGEVLQYSSGSKEPGIKRDSFATVREVDAHTDSLTVETEDGSTISYHPRRLRGVNVFRETSREFATGDRIQFTAPNKDLGVANRDLGTVVSVSDGRMTVKLDGKANRTVSFDTEHRIASAASDYLSRPDRTVIVAPDPVERQELTDLIRAGLRQQGRVAPESHTVSVLVEQELGNPSVAANYTPGDEIRYRKGGLAEHGIPDNSIAEVLSVNPSRNLITVETPDCQATYNPALLKTLTSQSTVYREEERDLAVGGRIQFAAADRENGIRTGQFATIERIGDDNNLFVRLDSGRTIELDPDIARHIEHGYAIEEARHLSADRVILTGESHPLAEQQAALARLNPHTKEIVVYTSNGMNLLQIEQGFESGLNAERDDLSNSAGLENTPELSVPEIDFEGYGLGL